MTKDRHRKGYYREYNMKHPQRLARIGIYIDKNNNDNKTKTELKSGYISKKNEIFDEIFDEYEPDFDEYLD